MYSGCKVHNFLCAKESQKRRFQRTGFGSHRSLLRVFVVLQDYQRKDLVSHSVGDVTFYGPYLRS